MADENQVEGAVTDGLGKLKDAAGGLTGDTGLQAEGKLDQLQGQAQQQYGDVLEQVQGGIDGTSALVRDNPFAAMGIAAGVGFLLGYLLVPSRR